MKNALLLFAQKINPQDNNIPTLSADKILENGLNIVYFLAGAVAVIIIIIAGIRYASSGGDSSRITAAKNALTYGIIGLIVILLAFTITQFVIGSVSF